MQQQHSFAEIEWKIEKDRKGNPSLSIGQRAIHSRYNALYQSHKVAKKFISHLEQKDRNLLIIIGLGLGYLPYTLHSLGWKNLLILDPFPIMRKSLPLHTGKWRQEIPVSSSFENLIYHITTSIHPNTKPEVIIHPGYEAYCQMEYKQVLDFLKTIFPSNKPNEENNPVISYRALNSIVQAPFYQYVDSLKETYKKEKAILVSAGPSLKACLPYLAKRQEGILFAALQALPLLQKFGVKVQHVVVADPQDLSGIIKDCKPLFDTLLVDSAVHPNTLKWCPEKTYLFNIMGDHLNNSFFPKNSPNNIQAPIATVSETQLLLAKFLGFHKILLTGMDFCWKNKRYAHRPSKAPSPNQKEMRFKIQAIDGSIAETESMYFHGSRYMNYICKQIHKKDTYIYQYTEGISINSVQQIIPSEIALIFNEKRKTPSLPKKKKIDPFLIALSKSLLLKASQSTHKARKKTSVFSQAISDKRMPFFNEIPLKNRREICLAYLLKLQHKARQIS